MQGRIVPSSSNKRGGIRQGILASESTILRKVGASRKPLFPKRSQGENHPKRQYQFSRITSAKCSTEVKIYWALAKVCRRLFSKSSSQTTIWKRTCRNASMSLNSGTIREATMLKISSQGPYCGPKGTLDTPASKPFNFNTIKRR